MTNVILGILFVVVTITALIWRTVGDARAVASGETQPGPAGATGLATGDFGSMGLGIDGGSAGHGGGGACGIDGGGAGQC